MVAVLGLSGTNPALHWVRIDFRACPLACA